MPALTIGTYGFRIAGADGPLPAVPERVLESRTAFFTPSVAATIKQIDLGLPHFCQQISWGVEYATYSHVDLLVHTDSQHSGHTELLIIDEADRLKATGLEQVRDSYDRHSMGVILIGMPGIEKRLARYPQLYSRIGFSHEYRPLQASELSAVLAGYFPDPDPQGDSIAHAAVLASIVRVINGNFRLLDRLTAQIKRIMSINHQEQLNPEVVDAAQESLLIGH
ncbi:AAA family ATPase [Rothia sp. (in: high G+C Gram-positive bacteria)]|uniref:AAA family ATPase n=1 Tax=Rothia sp. (in: high G+C Gram-positive bacteria) TaxID=1885016 RepID=UPI000EC8B4BF|nr:ATP-binding protein [Rothia sp. (in: high G+C Gram-positive bacteria)]